MKKTLLISILPVFVFFLLASSSPAQQQGVPVDGKDFYIGFVYPSFNNNPGQLGRDFHGFFGVYALVSSYEDNNIVKFAYFDAGGNEVASVTKTIRAKNAVQVPLDIASMKMSEPGDIPEYKACHITAKKPVNVQYFSTGACSGGSYLAIPTPALGKSYVIASYNDNPGQGAFLTEQKENAGGFFLVVAPFDSTKVTINPNGLTAGGHKRLSSYTVQLRRGQCYWVKGNGSNELNDMSGSIVTSDKPIAVLAGHEDAFLGGVNGVNVEARNFMIQQMIPAEDFESTGYVAMPLKDAPGTPIEDAGYGENFRVFTADTNNVGVQGIDSNGTVAMTTTPFFLPPREISNVGTPTEFHSVDGRKFSVMMYDLRNQGSAGAPSPCETMMTIVPMSHWRTSFLFYVPANSFEVLQNYYINVIGLKNDIEKGNIRYSFNGSATLNSLSKLVNKGKSFNFPNHPELEGARYEVSPGAYYITNVRTKIDSLVPIDTMLQGAFMVYHYGMRAIDPDRDLGDFCGDDFFFEYATPVGMSLSTGGGNPTAKIDTLCTSWHICVKDTGGIGIRSVSLLDDPNGNYYRPGKQYHNVGLDRTLDPDNKGEIDFSGNDTSVCFDVIVSNPLDSAYAPLYIVDSKGTHIVLDLRYQVTRFQISTDHIFSYYDTLLFPLIKVRQEICSTLVYVNTAPKGGKAFNVSSVLLKKNDGHFNIKSSIPKLPTIMKPGDTLKVNVCFTPKDTIPSYDSLLFITDCFVAPLPINGKGGTGIIYATDIDFGSVIVGTKSCLPLTVENQGTLPFTLTKNWLLHDTARFSIDSMSANRLPLILAPGGSITMTFCYSPTTLSAIDSTVVDWNTNIDAPYTNQLKSWSFIVGKPIKPGVIWDRSTQYFVPDSSAGVDSVVQRVMLLNISTAKTHVNQVSIIGQTSSEFHILTDQLNRFPLSNFDLSVGDKIWIDVVFKPDLKKPYPDRFSDRIDTIVATYLDPVFLVDSPVFLKLIGTWNKNGVNSTPQSPSFTIRPNPMTNGKSITVSFSLPTDGKVNFSIFDVLGREVYHNASLDSHTTGTGFNMRESEIPLPNLESGIYYVRLTAGKIVATQKLEIIK